MNSFKDLVERKQDVIFKKLCLALSNCNLNENKASYKTCNKVIEDFKWEYFNTSNNHLIDLMKISKSLFKNDWSAIDTEYFYECYVDLNRKKLDDKEFIKKYSYCISGITKSWMNFYSKENNFLIEVEHNNEMIKISSIEFYNKNVLILNRLLREIRTLVMFEN